MEGEKKRAAETTTILESEPGEEADMESNEELGGEEESHGANGLSGA